MTGPLLAFFLAASPAMATLTCNPLRLNPRRPCMPPTAERQRIMSLIGATTEQYKVLAAAQEDEQNLRLALREGESTDYAGWQDSEAKLKNAEIALKKAFDDVRKATEKSYRVGPNQRIGRVHGGLFDGDRASWKPALQLNELVFEVIRPGKAPVYLKSSDDPTIAAGTLNDGKVLLSIRVLERAIKNGSPAVLASVLEHEGRHFDELTGPAGLVGKDSAEVSAYGREMEIADDIGLEKSEKDNVIAEHAKRNLIVLERIWAAQNSGIPYRAAPGSKDDPYLSAPDQHLDDWRKYREPLDKIKAEQDELRDRHARINRGESPDQWRDSVNDRQPPDGATAYDGCGGSGWWAGEVYFPPMPCTRTLTEPTVQPSPATATPAPLPPAITFPRAAPALTGLAERICADPATAHSQPFHDDYRFAWFASNEDGSSMPKCPREIFLVLKRIRQEGYPDYNSQYFQSLAENLNVPDQPVVPPEPPDIDLPVPYGPGVPDCLRAEGRRCIRWR